MSLSIKTVMSVFMSITDETFADRVDLRLLQALEKYTHISIGSTGWPVRNGGESE